MKKKIEKKFFVFRRIPSDFVALYSVYQRRIVALGAQCVRKQF